MTPILTARDFLNTLPKVSNYISLPNQLKADPKRLRREFLEIATDPKERFDFRTRSLMLPSLHSEELDVCTSSEVVEALMTAFKKEFPSEKLDSIASKMRSEDCHPDGFLAYLFCIAFAKLGPANTQESIHAVQKALKGTSLEATLTKHLETIKRKRNS